MRAVVGPVSSLCIQIVTQRVVPFVWLCRVRALAEAPDMRLEHGAVAVPEAVR